MGDSNALQRSGECTESSSEALPIPLSEPSGSAQKCSDHFVEEEGTQTSLLDIRQGNLTSASNQPLASIPSNEKKTTLNDFSELILRSKLNMTAHRCPSLVDALHQDETNALTECGFDPDDTRGASADHLLKLVDFVITKTTKLIKFVVNVIPEHLLDPLLDALQNIAFDWDVLNDSQQVARPQQTRLEDFFFESGVYISLESALQTLKALIHQFYTNHMKTEETVARQTQQLTQLAIQVLDCQDDHASTVRLRAQMSDMEDYIVTLTEATQFLEMQLEEQNSKVGQVFELQCALQGLRMHLKQKEDKDACPQAATQHSCSDIDVESQHLENQSVASNSSDQVPTSDAPLTTLTQLEIPARNVEEHAVEFEEDAGAEKDRQIEALTDNLAKAKEEILRVKRLHQENAQLLDRVKKTYEREIVDLKNLVKKEKNARVQAEHACQKLLAQAMDPGHTHLAPITKPQSVSMSDFKIPRHLRLTPRGWDFKTTDTIEPAVSCSSELLETIQALKTTKNVLTEQLKEKTQIIAYLVSKLDLPPNATETGIHDIEEKAKGSLPKFIQRFKASSQTAPDRAICAVVENLITENLQLTEKLAHLQSITSSSPSHM